ncbi:hypothetical protein RF11_09679 [Thelohanellus kitauei]|uniref:Uncharacterized protein n=1 Tax=Thelohanellus kitauei TaxID=669202 RepID=A0A0C2MSZ7_THEKT|nr:hypothetical protein RF11_09679 [Thelohanellus kitauei]
MVDFIKDIFKDEKEQKLLSSLSCDTNINWYSDFDLTTICSNFQYDVSFKFFFNPISLIKWFASKIPLPNVENTNEKHLTTTDNSVELEDLNDSNINYGVLRSELRLQEQSSPINENNPQVRQSIDDLSTTITTSTCVLMLVVPKKS